MDSKKQKQTIDVTFKDFLMYEVHKINENIPHKFELVVPNNLKYNLKNQEYKDRLDYNIFNDVLYSEEYITVSFNIDNAVVYFSEHDVLNCIKQIKINDTNKQTLYLDSLEFYNELILTDKILLAKNTLDKNKPLYVF